MTSPVKTLSLFDSTCIIVGIIIGAGIYETTPVVAACMDGPVGTMAVWLAGGLLALCGALCYAELATAYPKQGGDYVYLTRAYGPAAGFLFGWSQLVVIRPGDIALMAFVFSRYATTLFVPFQHAGTVYAAGAVVLLTLINIRGVRESKWTQNLLAVAKVTGLLFVVGAGLFAPGVQPTTVSEPVAAGGLKLAVILVLFTYGGWNEMAYVAAEIKKPHKNIFRALVSGTIAVVLLYLLINWSFLHALGYDGLAQSQAVAVDAVGTVFPELATRLVGILICISALGAINGLIFTGARISYALGTGHRLFHRLGRWHPGLGTPVAALIMQGLLSLGIILIAGSFIDTILYSASAVWLFFFATGLSVFRLRKKDGDVPRSCKVPGYPVIPVLFCGAGLFMLFSSISYAVMEKPLGLLILFAIMMGGVVLHRID